MKRITTASSTGITTWRQPVIVILSLCFILLAGCKAEQKVASYNDLYSERPLTVLIAPVQDNAKRPPIRTKQDELFNQEYTSAALYMRETLSQPLVTMGYYTLPPLASDVVLDRIGMEYKQLMNGDLHLLDSLYHIDAVLLVAIHKWQEPEINEMVVYAEYTIRSTKTNTDLMHTWVRGRKIQPVDNEGEAIELPSDTEFMLSSGLDIRTVRRCILVEQMSDFVIRNLPISSRRWYYKHDQYVSANPSYYRFNILPDGSIEREEYNEDAFGNECFTD